MIHESRFGVAPPAPATDRALLSSERLVATNQTFYLREGKRLFDAVAAAVGLVMTSPLLLLCAVAVRLGSPGPIFFRQRRVGVCGKPFVIIKFRTMVHQTEKNGLRITADGDARITAAGRWLRKLKLDELPQLFNVLIGEMSLVGPRPEVPEYAAAYDADQARVLSVRPGITGPAALTYIDEEKVLASKHDKEAFYRNTLMPQKLELDLAYCEHINFLTDLQMIMATLRRLLHSRDGGSLASTLPPRTIHLSQGAKLEPTSQNDTHSIYSS